MQGSFAILCMGLVTIFCIPAMAEIDCNVYPVPVNISSCCSGPEFFTADLTEKCREYDITIPAKDTSLNAHQNQTPSYHSPCFVSCVFNQTGIFDEEQKLNETSLHEFLTSIFKDEFKGGIPILEDLFKTCVIEGDKMLSNWLVYKEERAAEDPDFADRVRRQECPLKPIYLMGCIFIKTFPKCPSKMWNDNDQCNNLRNFVRDCEPNIGKWYDSIQSSNPIENSV